MTHVYQLLAIVYRITSRVGSVSVPRFGREFGDDFAGDTLARFDRAFEIALRCDGGVFAAEMGVVFRRAFDPGEIPMRFSIT